MASDDDPKEFPDISQKLAAPKKLSAFEKERQAAEEKRRRAEAENAAALKDFEDSFGGTGEDEQDYAGAPPSGPRSGGLRFGGPPGRYGDLPRSGPGSLGAPPPSLKRKRALDEMREAQEIKREQQAPVDIDHLSRTSTREVMYSPPQDDDQDDIAPRPTVQLSSLPPTMTTDSVQALLRDYLPVHSVRFQPPAGPSLGKKSSTAIVTLAAETSISQIDTGVSALKDKYLGNGFRLSISRHLSSTSLLPPISTPVIASSVEPFGAQKVYRDQPGRFSMRNAPPPSEFAPPNSYDVHPQIVPQANATITVQTPSDIATIRAVHTIVDRLLSEPEPDRALEIEAMLMALPEVQNDERFSFLFDSRSASGVYYRFLLWNDDESYESIQQRKHAARGPERVFDDVVIDWTPPFEEIPFADLSDLGKVIDHPNYQSSDEESDDEEGDRRFNASRREGEGPAAPTDKSHLTPLQVAKFAWLLSRMPPSHSRLRKGDVAPITSFAINHAGAGAEEIVDMMVLNVEKPYTTTQCARFDNEDASQDEDDVYEPDEELPSIDSAPTSDTVARGDGKESEDPSAAKLIALYLANDVLHNSSTAGVRNAWKYRQLFENAFKRRKTFEHLGRLDKELGWGKMKMDKWRRQIGVLFEIWEQNSVFASDVFEALKKDFFEQPADETEPQKADEPKKLEDKWMGRFKRVEGTASPVNSASPAPPAFAQPAQTEGTPVDADIDGVPLDELDGAPMEDLDGAPMDDEDDVDGVPMDDDSIDDAQEKPAVNEASGVAKAVFSIKGVKADKAVESPGVPKRRRLAEDMFADSDEE